MEVALVFSAASFNVQSLLRMLSASSSRPPDAAPGQKTLCRPRGLVFPYPPVGSLPDFAIDHTVRDYNQAGGDGSWELFRSETESSSSNAICLSSLELHPQSSGGIWGFPDPG